MAFATGINLETGKTELFDFINVSKSGTYKGLWDASTNTPFLTNGTGEDGDYYEVSVGGTVNFGNGDIIFVVGDTVAYSRGKWQKGDKPLIDDEEISYDTTWSSAKILQVIETASTANVYTYKGETTVLPDGTKETPNNKGDVWLLTTDGLPYWWDGDVWRRFGVDAYTKTETENVIEEKLEPVETKLASALKYRGAVNTTALLPELAENGDTYFVKTDGFMYTYNSTTSSWDALGTVADMTNYFTKTEITAMLQDKADKFQYDVLPTPSSETVGLLLQYTGADTQDYKNGYFYECVSDEQNPPTYSWVQKNVQPNAESFTFNKDDFNIDSSTDKVSLLPSRRVFNGSKADWDLLSVAEKTQYGATAFTDDEGSGMDSPVDVVESGNMHAVTSNAVADFAFDKSKIRTGIVDGGSANNDDWVATFDTPFADSNYTVIVTPLSSTGADYCPNGWYVVSLSATGFSIYCSGKAPRNGFQYIAIHN